MRTGGFVCERCEGLRSEKERVDVVVRGRRKVSAVLERRWAILGGGLACCG